MVEVSTHPNQLNFIGSNTLQWYTVFHCFFLIMREPCYGRSLIPLQEVEVPLEDHHETLAGYSIFGVHDLQCGYLFQFLILFCTCSHISTRFYSHLPTFLLAIFPRVPSLFQIFTISTDSPQ
jgi:hypothetical protein